MVHDTELNLLTFSNGVAEVCGGLIEVGGMGPLAPMSNKRGYETANIC